MSKFKVKDKVRITSCYLPEQYKYVGLECFVKDTNDTGVHLERINGQPISVEDESDSYWLDEELELVQLKDWIVTKDHCEKIKEEKDMNKVVDLWYERKRDKIINEYKEKEVEFYNNRYSVVESFNELVEKFNNDLEDLYKLDKATEQFVLKENTPNNVIKYCLDLDKLKEEFEVEYLIKRNEELKEIEDIRIEVEAQLSLSNDLEYQQEVLIRYGIIDKKTKKIVD